MSNNISVTSVTKWYGVTSSHYYANVDTSTSSIHLFNAELSYGHPVDPNLTVDLATELRDVIDTCLGLLQQEGVVDEVSHE